jgi:hypothetical protein
MFRDGLRASSSVSFSLVSNPSDDHLPVGDFFAGRQLFRLSANFSLVGSFFAGRQLLRQPAVLRMIVRMLRDVLSADELFAGRRLFGIAIWITL